LPSVINANWAERKIYFKLNDEETAKLQNSINIIKDNINKMEF
jgi:malate/lactate dehydrogenase